MRKLSAGIVCSWHLSEANKQKLSAENVVGGIYGEQIIENYLLELCVAGI